MYIDVLDNLVESNNTKGESDGALEGKFNYNGSDVTVCVDPDDEDIDVTLWLAKKFLSKLEEYQTKAKKKLLEDMFDQYNEDWRQENEPVLSKAEFLEKLTLVHVYFLGSASVDFMYNDDGMFGGHSLMPQSFDGENFTYVQMYG